ncbi:hypothetical protein pmac_cds_522 [Pandoravirus macleodensis]|uniref:Uncharacterized protein n=1 Tax=Pandoravirus macleodensis TaxID=2107707 RepID=A0A2U7UFW5_9VIRU|nr:hypothetical protein pmac_cds_522 [Pandoravirus macleodensis]AVK77210.1 hypothetical protein pmac_cds_522 [Pandoravirus macleodensis]UMO79932.1 hypothetical protein [Pandoravirus aubagnensis]
MNAQTAQEPILSCDTTVWDRSRSLTVSVASWALGIVAAAAVFYWIALPAINRAHHLDATSARLCVADCHILGRTTIGESRYVPHGPSGVMKPTYLSGFCAAYTPVGGQTIDNVTLLVDIDPDLAWLFASERADLWARHPIGSYVRCYYDSAHRHRASLNNDLDEQMAWQITLAAVAVLPAVLCVGIAIGRCLAPTCLWLRQRRASQYAYIASHV